MKGRRVADRPEHLNIPIRLFDRVQKFYPVPIMPVIVADQIARQIDDLPDFDNPLDSFPAEDYGKVAPPFKRVFIEATTKQEPKIVQVPDRFGQMQPVQVPAGTAQRGVACYDVSEGIFFEQVVSEHHKRLIPPGTRWILAFWGFAWSTVLPEVVTFPGPAFIHLNSDGYILDDTRKVYMESPRSGRITMGPPDIEGHIFVSTKGPFPQAVLANYLPFVLRSIGAMHRRCEAERIEPEAKARRDALRRQKLELHAYYILKVRPTPALQPGDAPDIKIVGQPAKTERREHHVRGHFRYYTEEKPLFGRVSGAVFIPDHDRGAPTYGSIIKDYEVRE